MIVNVEVSTNTHAMNIYSSKPATLLNHVPLLLEKATKAHFCAFNTHINTQNNRIRIENLYYIAGTFALCLRNDRNETPDAIHMTATNKFEKQASKTWTNHRLNLHR